MRRYKVRIAKKSDLKRTHSLFFTSVPWKPDLKFAEPKTEISADMINTESQLKIDLTYSTFFSAHLDGKDLAGCGELLSLGSNKRPCIGLELEWCSNPSQGLRTLFSQYVGHAQRPRLNPDYSENNEVCAARIQSRGPILCGGRIAPYLADVLVAARQDRQIWYVKPAFSNECG